MDLVLYDGWFGPVRTLVVGSLAYIALIVFLRVSGSRTLSKMNAFDFVVTVALGSTLATILLNQDVSLVQGMAALALLVALQFIVTWTSVRAEWVRQVVTGEPVLLVFRGAFLADALRRSRVAEQEIRAAVRADGLAAVEDAEAVVLETDGSFSIVRRESGQGDSSLAGVRMPPEHDRKELET